MSNMKRDLLLVLLASTSIGACGLTVPQKEFLASGVDPKRQGNLENNLVANIKCEIEKGLYRVWLERNHNQALENVKWLYTKYESGSPAQAGDSSGKNKKNKRITNGNISAWGTSVSLTLQIDEGGGLNPGVSVIEPLQNAVNVFPKGGPVTTSQNFAVGVGATATAKATRIETIQFTFANFALLDKAREVFSGHPERWSLCNEGMDET